MAQVKGKFITLACSLLQTKPKAKEEALKKVKELTGKEFDELDPEGWYDTSVMEAVFVAIEQNSSRILANAAIQLIGQNVYPTIEKTVGLPKSLMSPLDLIKFEAEGFLQNHKGTDIKPRVIKEALEGRVLIEARSPGYNCSLIDGVYIGILNMCNAKNPEVIQTKCVKKGDSTCEYLITWKP